MCEFRKIDNDSFVNDTFYIQKINDFYSVYLFKSKEHFRKINNKWVVTGTKIFKLHKRFTDIDLLTDFLNKSGMKNPFINISKELYYSSMF